MIKAIAFTLYPIRAMKRARAFCAETLGLLLPRHAVRDFEVVEYDLAGGTFALSDLADRGPQRRNRWQHRVRGEQPRWPCHNVQTERGPDQVEAALNTGLPNGGHPGPGGNTITLHQMTQSW